jgi:hypothetical protein
MNYGFPLFYNLATSIKTQTTEKQCFKLVKNQVKNLLKG